MLREFECIELEVFMQELCGLFGTVAPLGFQNNALAAAQREEAICKAGIY